MKVCVITGSTGEYSDRQVWIAGIMTEEKDAKDFCFRMNQRLRKADKMDWDERDDLTEELRKIDDRISIDYTGTTYDYEIMTMDDIPLGLLKGDL